MAGNLTIGKVARAAGVNVETIRFYQRRGLLAQPARPAGGFRCYGEEVAARVRFIKRAQELGFTLEEVRSLLALEDGRSCKQARELAEKKLVLVESRLTDLNRMRRALKGLIVQCNAGGGRVGCPIIATLGGTR